MEIVENGNCGKWKSEIVKNENCENENFGKWKLVKMEDGNCRKLRL